MQPSKEQIENAARLVPGEFEWYCRGANNPNGEPNVPCIDGTEWQPWADTEAGRSDALVLARAVDQWFAQNIPTLFSDAVLYAHRATGHDRWVHGTLQEWLDANMAAAAAIGAHMKGAE